MVRKIVISSALVFIAVLLAALVACQQQGKDSVSSGSEGAADVEVVANDRDTVAGGGANASSGIAVDEGWPGQALGYVGTNGEGAYTQDDWETDEEYAAIMQDVYKEEYDAPSVVRDGSYIEGMLRITFDRSYGELRAREVVAESGGEWVSSDFKYYRSDSDRFIDGIATVNVYYPDALDEDSLLEVAAELEVLPEVVWAGLNGILHSSNEEESDYCVKYPAAYEGVISVAAVDVSDVIADFSNKNQYVDLCAPGVSIYTTANPLSATTLNLYYGTDSGTSFAAPQVAAAAALLKAQHSDWTPVQIESRLESTARDLGAAGRDDAYGYGALDAAKVVGWIDYSNCFGLDGHVMHDDTLDLQDLYCLPIGGHMLPSGRPTAAATRDAMPACLILGLDLVEESGQFVQLVRVG